MLLNHYGDNSRNAIQQLQSFKQETLEPIEVASERFLDLVRDAYGNSYNNIERQLIPIFVYGINDSLAKALIEHEPMTIQDAINIAKEKQSKNEIWEQRVRKNKVETMNILKIENKLTDIAERLRARSRDRQNVRENRESRENINSKEIVCYHCKKKGHIKRDCFHRRNRYRQQNGNEYNRDQYPRNRNRSRTRNYEEYNRKNRPRSKSYDYNRPRSNSYEHNYRYDQNYCNEVSDRNLEDFQKSPVQGHVAHGLIQECHQK